MSGQTNQKENFVKILAELERIIAKQREEISRLEHIIDDLPGDIYWKDKNGVYLGMNRQGVESLRRMGLVESKSDILGKTDYDLFDEATAGRYKKNDLQVMKRNVSDTKEEPVLMSSGELITQLSTKTPLLNLDGDVIGIMGTTIDITERKRQEEELNLAKQIAEKSNKLKSDFISNMEHDIRTPVAGIYGMASILAAQEDDPDKKENLEDVLECAEELMGYCNVILDFSKVEAESLAVTDKSFNLEDLVRSVLKLESMAAKQKQIDLSLEYDASLPKVVVSDPYRIKRILLNLTSNAIKFTKTGFARIFIELVDRCKDTRELILKITVEDSGIGIPDEIQDLVYERFSKMMLSNTGLYRGLGLGLRIAKQFIEELGGDIHLESEVGKGSKFTVCLPVRLPLLEDIIDQKFD